MKASRPIFITTGDFAAEAQRNGPRTLERGAFRHHFADQPHAKRGRGIEGIAEEQRAERLMLSDQPRQLHEMDRRDQADVDLGIAEGGAVAGDDHVAGDRDRHAAGPRRAVDGRDGRLAHPVLHVVEREIEPLEKALGLGRALAPDDIEVEPGAEHLVGAADDHGAHARVVPRLLQRRQQRVDQRQAQRVDRRAVERDLGNRIRKPE